MKINIVESVVLSVQKWVALQLENFLLAGGDVGDLEPFSTFPAFLRLASQSHKLQIDFFPAQPVLFPEVLDKRVSVDWLTLLQNQLTFFKPDSVLGHVVHFFLENDIVVQVVLAVVVDVLILLHQDGKHIFLLSGTFVRQRVFVAASSSAYLRTTGSGQLSGWPLDTRYLERLFFRQESLADGAPV